MQQSLMNIIRKPTTGPDPHHYIRIKAQVYITFVNRFTNASCGYITIVTQSAPLYAHSIYYKVLLQPFRKYYLHGGSLFKSESSNTTTTQHVCQQCSCGKLKWPAAYGTNRNLLHSELPLHRLSMGLSHITNQMSHCRWAARQDMIFSTLSMPLKLPTTI